MRSADTRRVDADDKMKKGIKKNKKVKVMLDEEKETVTPKINDELNGTHMETGLDASQGGSIKKTQKIKSSKGDTERDFDEFIYDEKVSLIEDDDDDDDDLSGGEVEEKKRLEEVDCDVNSLDDSLSENDDDKTAKRNRRKQRLIKEAAEAKKRGICYLSRIPPHMDHVKLRHILSQYGEIKRIYLAPEDPNTQVKRKRAGGFRGQEFSEGWVEFSKKVVAKRVANMLNGEQIGGRKRSAWYYDLWNIKYLSKFKWDDLTEEIAYKMAIREKKLALEINAAKRERDIYLSKVDQSRELAAKEERLKKKQKVQQNSGENAESPVEQQAPKVVRHFPQKQPVTERVKETKSRLSSEVLAGVFGAA